MPNQYTGQTPLIDRFWSHVTKTEECWVWTGTCNEKGYGQLHDFRLGMKAAHRLSYEFAYGTIPVGMCVLHRCDNPPCVRPDHLYLGTHQQNALDKHMRHRSGLAKLTEEQVREIRWQYFGTTRTQADLGKQFGVTKGQISMIIRGKSWAFLSDAPAKLPRHQFARMPIKKS